MLEAEAAAGLRDLEAEEYDALGNPGLAAVMRGEAAMLRATARTIADRIRCQTLPATA